LNNIQQCQRLILPPLLKPGHILGVDRLISTENVKYIDSIPSDLEPEYLPDETSAEQLLLEGGDLIEERLPANVKRTVPIESMPE